KIMHLKIRYLLVSWLLLMAIKSNAQMTYKIDGFSKDYYGKIHLEDTTAIFTAGWVGIYDKTTNQQLVSVKSDRLAAHLSSGHLKANVIERPYGEQSSIIYEDFNFDGITDFALANGRKSCYGGPSFSVYLVKNHKLSFSKAFTKLAMNYCGMFGVSQEKERLYTMTKSGCCWHQFNVYKVKNNTPYLIKSTEEQVIGVTFEIVQSKRVNGKMVEKKWQRLNEAVFTNHKGGYYDNLLAKFTFPDGKKMFLFNTENVYYAFTDENDKIELLYDSDFYYNQQQDCIFFSNGNATYRIYKDKLEVIVNGKT